MIHVVATISLRPGTRSTFADEFARIVPLVRSERGCLYYAGGVDVATGHRAQAPPRPDAFVVIERWESLAALEAHSTSPHMTAWRERVRPYMLHTAIQVLEPAGEP